MIRSVYGINIFIMASTLIGCNPKAEQQAGADSTAVKSVAITTARFGKMSDGTAVSLYTLTNASGMTMKVMNYGGIIVSLTAPDKNGTLEDVVLGYDSLSHYIKRNPYFGALIGRYGNRIAKGKFNLEGKAYQLAQNNNGNHLHGGVKGFDKVFWNIEEFPSAEGKALKLTYLSKDGEEGYPGNLQIEVIYILTDKNELKINYKATTDKKTIVNLTNHTYFNLSGNAKTDIREHELMLNADKFVPVDKTLIPSDGLKDVVNTPFDFRTPTVIGSRIDNKDQQLEFGGGYDHCWVLNIADQSVNKDPKKAATLSEPTSGRLMTVYTTEPGIQFYSGNFLDGSNVGKGGVVYKHRHGLCLETEHFPDSPNRKEFPSVVLNPGEVYQTQTIYAFSVK